jgi:hypothetical protein
VRHGRGADAAFGAHHRDDAAGGDGLGRREQAADRAHDVEHPDRADHVIVDAAAHQLAIGNVIGFVADDDDAGAGIADMGELVEEGHELAPAAALQHDHVRRRRVVVGLDGGGHAAHLHRQMRFRKAAVLARRFHRRRGRLDLAKGLHRNARRSLDMIARRPLRRHRQLGGLFDRLFDFPFRVAHCLPTSLSLAFSLSG